MHMPALIKLTIPHGYNFKVTKATQILRYIFVYVRMSDEGMSPGHVFCCIWTSFSR